MDLSGLENSGMVCPPKIKEKREDRKKEDIGDLSIVVYRSWLQPTTV